MKVKLKIHTGDTVTVIAGKDKGKRGTVTKIVNDGARVLVEGVNRVKKHQKGNPQQNIQGGIILMEAPLAISNLALINPKTDKADKIGFRVLEDGTKVRYFKSNGEQVEA